MIRMLVSLASLSILLPALLAAQPSDHALEAELDRIDAMAADPNGRLVVAAAMSDHLQVHRNRLALLRRQTGQSYSRIFVSLLEGSGASRDEILRRARDLNREIDRIWREYQTGMADPEPFARPLRPVMYVGTNVDHNAAGSFYSVTPHLGIQSRTVFLGVAAPFYRNSAPGFSPGGVGDVCATGWLMGQRGLLGLGGGLTVGFPTGDEAQGLGAGKVTVDGTALVSGVFENARPFLSAGLTNSVFNNVGYQRPYITDGGAFHLSGGVEVRPARRLLLGGGAFAVRPFGAQILISRVVVPEPSLQPDPVHGSPPVNLPPQAGGKRPQIFQTAPVVETTAEALRDHGPNAWATFYLHESLSLNFAVSRSVPFGLTTVRGGVGFDVARWIFPGRRF